MARRSARTNSSPSPRRGAGRGERAKPSCDVPSRSQPPRPPLRQGGRSPAYRIAIANRQRAVRLDVRPLRHVAEHTLRAEQVKSAEISIALVADEEIGRVNKQFLNHNYPTDVVSFLLESSGPTSRVPSRQRSQPRGASKTLHGEIVIGVDYATRTAADFGWPVQYEVILYLVHGLLHLCGYDDLLPPEKRIMRRRETAILHRCGITHIPRRRPRFSNACR